MFGQEIDPALSALAGFAVGVAAVPPGKPLPSLRDFLPGANRANMVDLGHFRSLRPASRGYEASLAGAKQLAPWLSASLNGRLDWSRDSGLNGLPFALFRIAADNGATPFGRDVLLALADDGRPLANRIRRSSGSLSLTFNANFDKWPASLGGHITRQTSHYLIDRVDSTVLVAPILVDRLRNPFEPSLKAMIPVITDLTRSRSHRLEVQANIEGPLFDLPTGPMRIRAGVIAGWSRLTPRGAAASSARFRRSDTTMQAGFSIPLTSRNKDVLAGLGDMALSFDLAHASSSDQPSLNRHSWDLAWQLRRQLRLTASRSLIRRPVDPELLAAPVVTYVNSRTYDPVGDESVDVTFVFGGNAHLRPERQTVTRFAAAVAPWSNINLQVQEEYRAVRTRNQLGGLPPASPAVMAAFPDRFQRDASGRLTLVDRRTVNFSGQKEDAVRYGFSFTVPLYRVCSPSELAAIESDDGESPVVGMRADSPKPRIQASFNHTLLLSSKILIREGLPPIDLLGGGAIGIGGGRVRHLISGSIALFDRGVGLRLSGDWRSRARLVVGTSAQSSMLRFDSIGTLDIQIFAASDRLLPGQGWAKGGRISLRIDNIANRRQRVTDAAGNTPLNFQPAYRDAVGRTVMFEFRKVL